MKDILLTTLTIYQEYISPLFHQLLGVESGCRQVPTCSEYSKEAIQYYGIWKGMLLSIRRVMNCQPFFSL
jgi:putative membrane protein insertion efficiency factor